MHIGKLVALGLVGAFAIACGGTSASSIPEGASTNDSAVTSKKKAPASTSTPATATTTTTTTTVTHDAGAPAASTGGADGDDDSNVSISAGGGGRVASGGDCCFQGQYFSCPDETACFGGFDSDACDAKCGDDFDCTMACVDKLDSAPPPKGCTQKTAPPNIQCGG